MPNIDIRPDHWEIVRDILRKHVPQYEVWAFGSRAKWTAKTYSDLDLAVITDKPLHIQVSANLAEAFSESDLPWKVDVVDWATTSESFRKVIKRERVPVCKKLEGRAEMQLTACTVAEIAAPSRNALVGGPFGSDLVSRDYVPVGVPVIRGVNMGHGRWVGGKFVCVTNDKADSLAANCAKPGDLVITQRGTLGQVSIVPEGGAKRYVISQSQMKLTVDTEKADPLFIYYVFSSEEQQKYIQNHAIRAGVPHTNLGILRNTPLRIPALSDQKKIASILGSLDDKIELNRKMNGALEAMARALFKAWFVDFEPVRAKMEGREPYFPADMWQLFPGRLDEEGRPEGWGMRPIGALLSIVGGGTPTTSVAEYWDGDVPWFSVVDTPAAGDIFVVATEKTITKSGLANSSARLIPKGTTIISARGTVGNLAIAGREMAFNQSCYGLRGAEGVGDYFVYLIAQHMVGQLQAMAHGSVFSTITRQTFDAINQPVPPTAILNAFERTVSGWFDAIFSSVKESRSLVELRNMLLPKLISGELRLPDAESLAEAILP